MKFTEYAEQRQSCRRFEQSLPVEREQLEQILTVTNLAPSACNAQPYNFAVVTGAKVMDVAKATQSMGMNRFASDAGAFIVISESEYNRTAKVGAKIKHQDYRSVDIGIATAYICFAAMDQGLSSCILGWFDEKKLQNLLNCRDRIRLVIALGYAQADDPLRQKKRKDLNDLVYWLED